MNALQLGWTQNVVTLAADLSMENRYWYIRGAKQLEWSKVNCFSRSEMVHMKRWYSTKIFMCAILIKIAKNWIVKDTFCPPPENLSKYNDGVS